MKRYRLYQTDKLEIISVYEDINNGKFVDSKDEIVEIYSIFHSLDRDNNYSIYDFDIFDSVDNIWIFKERLNSICNFLSEFNIQKGDFSGYETSIKFFISNDILMLYNTLMNSIRILRINCEDYKDYNVRYKVDYFIENFKMLFKDSTTLKPIFRKKLIDDII